MAVFALAQLKLAETRSRLCGLADGRRLSGGSSELGPLLAGAGLEAAAEFGAGSGVGCTLACSPSKHSTLRSVSSMERQRTSSGACAMAGRLAASSMAA